MISRPRVRMRDGAAAEMTENNQRQKLTKTQTHDMTRRRAGFCKTETRKEVKRNDGHTE